MDATTASKYAWASGVKNAPATPPMKNMGSTATMTISVAKTVALRVSSVV